MRLYIDPGTGSMLFAILIGVIGALNFLLKNWIVKLRFILSGGKKVETNTDRIPLVIFSDDKRYWSVFEPLCREFDKRGTDVVYMTASPDDPALSNPYEHIKGEFIGENNMAFARLNFLNACIVLSTTPGLDVYQWKRSKNVQYYIHMQHGANDVTGYRMFGLDYYDAVLLSGEYQARDVRQLEKMRGLPPKELVIVGIPYMDEMVRRLKENSETPPHERTVLLAPSWGDSAIFSRYGGKIIDVLLQTGYLTIEGADEAKGLYYLRMPNREVEEAYDGSLLERLREKPVEHDLGDMCDALKAGETKRYMEVLASFFAGIPYMDGRRKEADYALVVAALARLMRRQVVAAVEERTSEGRIDLSVVAGEHVYVMEYKVDKSAEAALRQIKEKRYADKFRLEKGKTIHLLGIAFSSTGHTVQDWKEEVLA